MNPLAHWNQTRLNQLNELDDLQHRLRNIVRRSRAQRPKDEVRVPQWIPLVEVSEDARGYVIKAELPQVKKEDVRITLDEGTLVITGERGFDQNRKNDQPLPLACGRFAHRFVIPNDAWPHQGHRRVQKWSAHSAFDQKCEDQPRTTQGQSFRGSFCPSQHRRVPVIFHVVTSN